MTRIFVQRGSGGSSSSASRPPSSSVPYSSAPQAPSSSVPYSSAPQAPSSSVPYSSAPQAPSNLKSDEHEKEIVDEQAIVDAVSEQTDGADEKLVKNDDVGAGTSQGVKTDSMPIESSDKEKTSDGNNLESAAVDQVITGSVELKFEEGSFSSGIGSSQIVTGGSCPPPPPVPPPKPSTANHSPRRTSLGSPNAVRIGSSRRQSGWPVISSRSPPSDSRPSSPRSYGEGEGYNSADEQSHCYGSSYHDAEQERLFEIEIRRVKGFEVKRMLEDGNCLFRSVADQVYGDPEAYDVTRQMCIDYMERERDHFSQFITEGFTSYCRRKRRDMVYGNNVEIQAFAEMYNRPIHIYSYSTEPINIFQGNYVTDTPIRLSYHHGNHYNSLVDPRRLTVGAGLGFSSLRGRNIDKDQVKAAIKAQQDQQIDNALLAEGRFYSDMELTEKEIERMVMEASRAEYLAEEKSKQYPSFRESSTSRAEPSSSGATTGSSGSMPQSGNQKALSPERTLASSIQMVLAMGFSYMQAIEAYSIFGDDVDSMICYLVEMGGNGASPGGSYQRKGKAAE